MHHGARAGCRKTRRGIRNEETAARIRNTKGTEMGRRPPASASPAKSGIASGLHCCGVILAHRLGIAPIDALRTAPGVRRHTAYRWRRNKNQTRIPPPLRCHGMSPSLLSSPLRVSQEVVDLWHRTAPSAFCWKFCTAFQGSFMQKAVVRRSEPCPEGRDNSGFQALPCMATNLPRALCWMCVAALP